MFNTLSHKGNTDQNDSDIPSHPSQNSYHQENKQQMLGKNMERKRDSHTLLVGM
jgi:hypothetical protein